MDFLATPMQGIWTYLSGIFRTHPLGYCPLRHFPRNVETHVSTLSLVLESALELEIGIVSLFHI